MYQLSSKKIVYILLLITYGIWKFYPSLELGKSVSFPSGDGVGTIANFSEVADQIKTNGVSYLLNDLSSSELLGNGIATPYPFNILQKSIVGILSIFTKFDNIYDYYAMFGFILVGISTFLLLIKIDTKPYFALVGAILMMNNDNYVRYECHLTLAIPFIPIFLTFFIIKAAEENTYKRFFLVALFTVLNFLMNEYYGYFGVYFSVFLFFGLLLYYQKDNIKNYKFWIKILKLIALSSILFIALMLIVYPNILFKKIVSVLFNDRNSIRISFENRDYADFVSNSIKNHFYYFYPGIMFLKNLFPKNFFTTEVFWEQSFRVGFILPFSVLLMYIIIIFKNHESNKIYKKYLLFIFAFLPALVGIFLFSNDPRRGISLVGFTYNISGIFRVGARAYLYIYILSIVIFFYYLNIIWAVFNFENKFKKLLKYILTMLFIIVLLFDVTEDRWYKQFNTYSMPSNEVYTFLKKLQKGLVCEIPFYSLPDDPPELSYIYYYNSSIYKMPLLNYQISIDSPYYPAIKDLSIITKYFNENMVNVLRNLGVKYLVIDNKNTVVHGLINNLDILYRNNDKSLYEIKNSISLNKDEFKSILINDLNNLNYQSLLSVKAMSPYFSVGSTILFNNKKSKDYIFSGFSSVEDWGTWSNEKKGMILFKNNLDDIKNAKYLEISFVVFSDGKYVQHVKLELNNNIILNESYSKNSNYIIKIPIRGKLKNENELVILTPDAISPQELHVNNDTRKLSIGMIYLKIY